MSYLGGGSDLEGVSGMGVITEDLLDVNVADESSVSSVDSGLLSIISDTGNDLRKTRNSLLEDDIEQKFSEITVPAQKDPNIGFKPKIPCSRFCSKQCQDYINTISDYEIESLRSLLKSNNVGETKNNVQKYLKMSALALKRKPLFFFSDRVFCINVFSTLSGVSVHILNSVLKDLQFGRQVNYDSSSSVGRYSEKKTNVIGWILDFAETAGQNSPDDELIVLPKIFTKNCLYKRYLAESQVPKASLSSFYTIFDEVFGPRRTDMRYPHIRISSYSTHSKGDICIKLQKERENIKNV